MARPLLFDATFTAARLRAEAPTGIERVDAAFAHQFMGRGAALHYGLGRPHVLNPNSAARLLGEAVQAWSAEEPAAADPVFKAVADWLGSPASRNAHLRIGKTPTASSGSWARTAARTRWRLTHDGGDIPEDALYLNVAQYAFEYPVFFRWLDRRPDVKPVVFIHDLLPLDCPEFFREGYQALFERRVRTMMRAKAVIVSNDIVAERVEQEFARRGLTPVPIFAEHLPPPTDSVPIAHRSDAIGVLDQASPYFVAIGTIEPRKNHLLLLNAWRELATASPAPPRLILVGTRGWDNDQTVDLLDRGLALQPIVAEASGLSTAGLRRLIAGSRAVLMPSFVEGYGLPIAEALAQGIPVLASDIAVFRDVSQGKALLLDPLDGPAWRQAVLDLAAPDSVVRSALVDQATAYKAPTWANYFARLDAFLDHL